MRRYEGDRANNSLWRNRAMSENATDMVPPVHPAIPERALDQQSLRQSIDRDFLSSQDARAIGGRGRLKAGHLAIER